MKNNNHKSGSALLIALIIMGILMMLSLGVGSLMLDSVSLNRLILEKSQAWYAAESGVELALDEIATNKNGLSVKDAQGVLKNGSQYSYSILATASRIPSVEENYQVLHLNENVTIPLFKGDGDDDQVKKFKLDYFTTADIKLNSGIIPDNLDVLRWKIFGLNAAGALEIINDFTPSNLDSTADSPTCVGTEASCYSGVESVGEIEDFLKTHHNNFLVISNMINIDLITAGTLSDEDKRRLANIKFRVAETDGKINMSLPVMKISADGTAGSAKQSFDLNVARDTFLPVFNYALYRTAD